MCVDLLMIGHVTQTHGGYFEVLDTLKSMVNLVVKELWYTIDRQLQLLYDDNGSINMVNVAKRTEEAHLFVVHIVSEAVVVDDEIESNLEYAIVEVNVELGGGGLCEVVLGGEGLNEVDLGGGGEDEGDLGGGGEDELGGEREDEFHVDLGGGGGQEGVFETKVDIKAEVHSWVDSETEDEEFVDIPINIMGILIIVIMMWVLWQLKWV